jgi:hypothetical protein
MSSSPCKFNLNPPAGSKVIRGYLCTHLRSLNVVHFEMTEAMRLKKCRRGHFNGTSCVPNFMKIHQSVETLLVGDTDRHAGDLINLLSFLGSRLKLLPEGFHCFLVLSRNEPEM